MRMDHGTTTDNNGISVAFGERVQVIEPGLATPGTLIRMSTDGRAIVKLDDGRQVVLRDKDRMYCLPG